MTEVEPIVQVASGHISILKEGISFLSLFFNVFLFLFLFFSFPLFFFIAFQVQLSLFSPHHSPPPQPSSPPTLYPTPLWLCPWVLYICSIMTQPLLSPVIPFPPLVTVCLFFISVSGYILLAGLYGGLGFTYK